MNRFLIHSPYVTIYGECSHKQGQDVHNWLKSRNRPCDLCEVDYGMTDEEIMAENAQIARAEGRM